MTVSEFVSSPRTYREFVKGTRTELAPARSLAVGRSGVKLWVHTFGRFSSAVHAAKAILELILGTVKLGKRRRQMFELLVELLLDLRQLLWLKRV